MRLAFDSVTGGESLPLEVTAEQLDSFRRVHRLTMITLANYYMATCRALHSAGASGPTAVGGWKGFFTGEPFVRSRSILFVGNSGSHVYSAGGNKHHAITRDLEAHAGFPNVHDFSQMVGVNG